MSTVTLKKPITAHGQEVETLTFREPTGEDIVACGYPLRIFDGGTTPEAGAIAKYISRLGDIPPSSVKQLGADDFNACLAVIVGFFGEEEAATT